MSKIDIAKGSMDVTSVAALIGTFAGWLPAVATLLTIIWTFFRIMESAKSLGWLSKSDATPELPPPGPFDPTN